MSRPAFPALAAVFLALLTSCSSVTYPPASGTWTFSLVSQITPSHTPQTLTGTITAKDADASASLAFSNNCFTGQMLAFTGSIDGSGALKLTSTTYKNQNIYMTGTLSPDGSYFTGGTYTVTPDDNTQPACAGSDSGTASGKRTSPSTASTGAENLPDHAAS